MCGITGYIGNSNFDKKKILKSIEHRGPDNLDSIDYKNVFLGHSRLSIIDLSKNANQPMISDDNNYIVVYNGEIYNHLSLRDILPKNKYNFKTTSDTETLLYLYIEFGDKIFEKLNGIFAFAILNKLTNEIILCRDPFGVKPLYYYYNDNNFIFSSEIKTFTQFDFFNNELNIPIFSNYISFLWNPGNETPFKFVNKVPPGSFINISLNNIKDYKTTQFYSFNNFSESINLDEKAAISLLEDKLFDSVKRQLMSDVPVAFFLSGGIDSAAMVIMAKKIIKTRIRCYTIRQNNEYNDGFTDDLIYARKIAKILDLDLVEVDSVIDNDELFDKMIYYLDEPQADLAPIHVYNICKKAKIDGYKVLIGGTAGDDLFSGYRRHQLIYFHKYFKFLPIHIFFKNTNLLNIPILRRFSKFSNSYNKNIDQFIYNLFTWLPKKKVLSLFNFKYRNIIFNHDIFSYFKKINIYKNYNPLNKLLAIEQQTFLVNHNLNYTDKLSMATGVEVRVPFLDLELIEFANNLNCDLKIKNGTTKYILKKMLEKYLPNDIIYRNKTGFGTPLRTTIFNDFKMKIENLQADIKNYNEEIFDVNEVDNLILEIKQNKTDGAYSLLSLISINTWLDLFYRKKEKSKK
jgi:asparagine synthase (glutamine-hydrolysing)